MDTVCVDLQTFHKKNLWKGKYLFTLLYDDEIMTCTQVARIM